MTTLTPAEAERLIRYLQVKHGQRLTTDQIMTVINWAMLVRRLQGELDAMLRQPAAKAMGAG